MIKLTENQLLFLKEAIHKEEEEQMIGYPDSDGQLCEHDKEIIELLKFLRDLKSGQVLTKEGFYYKQHDEKLIIPSSPKSDYRV
jgi:hypothetical protein